MSADGTTSRWFKAVAWLVVIGLSVLAVVVAVSAASDTVEDGEPRPGFVLAGDLALTVPEGWRASKDDSGLRDLGLANGIALERSGADSAATLLVGQDPYPPPGLVSAPLRKRLGGGMLRAPSLVRLPAGEGLRHDSPAGPDGRRTVAYLLPNDQGVVTAVCSARAPDAAAQLESCAGVLSTLGLTRSRPQSATPDPDLQAALEQALEQVNTGRRTGVASLRAKRTPAGQALAAGRLADLHVQVARDLQAVTAPPVAEEATARLVAAVDAVGAGYRSLSAAASAGDRRGYERARTAVEEAETVVNARLEDLRLLGYGVGGTRV